MTRAAGRCGVVLLLAIAVPSWPRSPFVSEASADCLACHGAAAVLTRSVHAGLACADCHAGFKAEELPHAKTIRPVDCASCHAGAAPAHAFHAAMQRATGCKGCHGMHDIASPKAPGTKFSRANLAAACGECHAETAAHCLDSAHLIVESPDCGIARCCLALALSSVSAATDGSFPGAVERDILQVARYAYTRPWRSLTAADLARELGWAEARAGRALGALRDVGYLSERPYTVNISGLSDFRVSTC